MCYCLHLNIPTCMEAPKRGNSERGLLRYKTCFKRTQRRQFHHVSWMTRYHRDITFASAWGFRFAPCNDSSRWSDGRKGLLRDYHLLLSGPILFMLLKVEQNVYMWKKCKKRINVECWTEDRNYAKYAVSAHPSLGISGIQTCRCECG